MLKTVSGGGGGAGANGITTLIGDVSAGPGTGLEVATLATVNSNIGTFTNATVTINAKGLVIGASNGSASGGNGGITELTGDGTAGPGNGTQALTLANSGVTAGVYGDATHVAQITVDAKGRVTIASNVTITGNGGGGGNGLVTSFASANITASANTRYLVDTFSANVVATLAASPTSTDIVAFTDSNGAFGTHTLTIVPNGKNIAGSNANVILSINYSSLQIQYTGLQSGWVQIP